MIRRGAGEGKAQRDVHRLPKGCRLDSDHPDIMVRREYGIDLPILNLPSNLPWEMVELFIRTMAPAG